MLLAEGLPLLLLQRLRLSQLLLGLLRLGLGQLHAVEVLEVAGDDGDGQGEHQHTWGVGNVKKITFRKSCMEW